MKRPDTGLITVLLSPQIAGSAGPPSVNFEGPRAIFRAIAQGDYLISTPAAETTFQEKFAQTFPF